MTVAKASQGGVEKKGAQRLGRLVLRDAKNGVFNGQDTEITLKPSALKALSGRRTFIRHIVESYLEAASQAEQSGEAVDLTIKVTPERTEPTITRVADGGDALDRALTQARTRGAARVADILKSPDMLSARAFGDLVDLSHETVNQKRKVGEILGLEGARRGLRYPRWQIAPGDTLLPGLKAVFEALGGQPWTIYRFLLQHHNELGATALEALKARRVDEVLGVARNISMGTFA